MTTRGIYEIKRAADMAEAEARRLHAQIKDAIKNTENVELTQIRNETIDLILELYSKRSGLIERDEVEAKLAEFMEFGEEKIEEIMEVVAERARVEKAKTSGHVERIAEEAIQPGLASVERAYERMKEWLEEKRLANWSEAVEKFREFVD